MTNTMPMLTDEQREELIKHNIAKINSITPQFLKEKLPGVKRHLQCEIANAQIALAALTADKSKLGEIESGIRALKMTLTKCNRMNYCRGVIMNLDDVVAKAKERTYTAPPVPALKLTEEQKKAIAHSAHFRCEQIRGNTYNAAEFAIEDVLRLNGVTE